MRAVFTAIILLTAGCQFGFAQLTYNIQSHTPTARAFKTLLLKNGQIEDNDTLNEEALDLVAPTLMDSVIRRNKEHHQVFLVGWIIHVFGGYNWRALSPVKRKFIGTVMRNTRSSQEEYSEYDINYDLSFHLNKYLNDAFFCYDCQKKIHRQDIRRGKHLKNYNVPPFVRDTNNIDVTQYRLHCELTPPRAFRPQLNYLFYPTLPGLALREHANFNNDHPSMGFFGTNCLDCNHSCHPELHPYEWTWWLNLKNNESTDRTWLVGLFHEGSNRFTHWSLNPKTGTINIPFAFLVQEKKSATRAIKVNYLVFNRFNEGGLSKMDLPKNTFDGTHAVNEVSLVDSSGAAYFLQVLFSETFPTTGLKYWFSEVNYDEQSHILSGYFNMAVSVQDLFTARVTVTQ